MESLEHRIVPDVRSITGFGNNLADPDQGQSGTDLIRRSPVAYVGGISTPSAPNNLSPREISNNLSNQSAPIFSFNDNLGNNNQRELSDFSYAFGQFIDHDMDLTLDSSGQAFNIPADPTRQTGSNPDLMGVEPFTRSQFDPNTGTTSPRQQINQATSYLDLSQVYGTTAGVASALRTHFDGLLKTSPGDFLPLNNTTYFTAAELATISHDEGGIANDAHQVPDSQLFVAGDKRVNEVIELTAQQTLFMRNHNRLAGQLESLHPYWTDEQLYQEARKLNIAEYENIIYNGYLPSILGTNAVPAFTGYNPNVNAAISTEFSTVGFRFGHSLLSSAVGRDNNDGTGIHDVNPNGSTVNLTEDFFRPDQLNNNHVTVNLVDRFGNPDPHTSSTVGEIMKALADGLPNEFDLKLIDEVRNILFGIPHGPGTDLAARDIQRTRDHGIGTYNQVRVAFHEAPVTTFAQISSDPAVQALLQSTYGTVDRIDPFIGQLAEDIIPGSDVGPTVRAILVDQFTRLRDGDRFFYLHESFNAQEQSLLAQGDDYADVIQNNTSITNLQGDVFFNRLEISGTVFNDPDGNGIREAGEAGIQGVTVNLNDANGVFVSSTVTDVNGEYDFTELAGIPATGNYTLMVVPPAGFIQTAAEMDHNPGTVHLSRGDLQIDGQNFGIKAATPSPNGGGSSGDVTVVLTSGGPASPGSVGGTSGSVQDSSPVSQPTDQAAQPSDPAALDTSSDSSQLPDSGQIVGVSSAGDLTAGLAGDSLASTSAIDQVFAQL